MTEPEFFACCGVVPLESMIQRDREVGRVSSHLRANDRDLKKDKKAAKCEHPITPCHHQ